MEHFVRRFAAKLGKRIDAIPAATLNALRSYRWPGNVRELRNVLERAVILSRGPRLELGSWLPKPEATASPTTPRTLEEIERRHILDVLESTGWRVRGARGAAAILDIKPTTLEARMHRLGIERPGARVRGVA